MPYMVVVILNDLLHHGAIDITTLPLSGPRNGFHVLELRNKYEVRLYL